jgi:predicted CXXCH cytochrome family protein
MCVLCHEIPAAGGQARLVEPSAPLCFRCHAKDAFQGGFVHGPIAAGSCITCHAPHGSGNSGMLRVAGPKLCLACHKDMDVRLINAGFSHKAAVNDCIDCHSPHASEQRYQLRKAVPGLCEGCHENIFRDLKEAVIHSPVTEEPACLNCHDPHMAENEWLLPADDMGACLKCHNEPVKAGQSELAPMGPLLAANPRHHGPIQSRECSECHNPHGSSYFRLLTAAYPQRLYAPFFESNYALCFRCHESTLVTEEHTETLTGFRDGDRNLHFVHVKNPSLGRTCRLCHETHASSQPEYIRASVPFGTWNLPIKFKKTENGGSCEPGCHAAQTYAYQTTQPGRP